MSSLAPDEEDSFIIDDEGDMNHFNDSEGSRTDHSLESEELEIEEEEKTVQVKKDPIGEAVNLNSSALNKTEQILKAHISILCSALGGIDYSSDQVPQPYKLGDDALACLKDIKRWLKSVDEETRKLDVAIACAESGLVVNDLIVILAQWEDESSKKKVKNKNYMEKIILVIVELLVPLTWPFQLTKESTNNQVKYYAALKKAQITYKKHILAYSNGKALRAVVRLTLPILKKSKEDRTPRDNTILKLCIVFFRNILKIEPADATVSTSKTSKQTIIQENLPEDVSLDDISLNTILLSFEKNKVLDFFLTITNTLGSEFDSSILGTSCLECFYYITKGVNTRKLFIEKTQAQPHSTPLHNSTNIINNSKQQTISPQTTEISSEANFQLQDLLQQEAKLKKLLVKGTSARHARFGTLLSLQTVDHGRLTISGQKGITENSSALAQLDASKNWRLTNTGTLNLKVRGDGEIDEQLGKQNIERFLNIQAIHILKEFIASFIEGCFNPLVYSIRNRITADPDAFLSMHKYQFFMLVGWTLEFETERRIANEVQEIDNGLFTRALEQEFIAVVITSMRSAYEGRLWSLVQSTMECFKQVLSFADLIGNTATATRDILISEGIKERLFNRTDTLDLLANIPKNAYKISPDYLLATVQFVYVVLKILERFSKQEKVITTEVVRKRKPKKSNNENDQQEVDDSEVDSSDEEDAKSVTRKKIDFARHQAKFIHKDTIQTHIALFSRFQELEAQDIKRCLSYFHRVFYKSEHHIELYRLDFMLLLHQICGNEPISLPRSSPVKSEVINFTKLFMKQLVKQLEKTPALFVELPFTSVFKENRIRYYLEHGELFKEAEAKDITVAKDLVVKTKKLNPGNENSFEELEEKISIIVASMIDEGERELVELVKEQLSKISDSRSDWISTQEQFRVLEQEAGDGSDKNVSAIDETTAPDAVFETKTSEDRKLLLKNGRLRLLLQTLGFRLPSTILERCILYATDVNLDTLLLQLSFVSKYLQEPVVFPQGKTAADYIISKNVYYEEQEDGDFGYDNFVTANDGYSDEDDEAIAFELEGGGKNAADTSALDQLDELEKRIDEHGKDDNVTKLPLGQARRKLKKGIKKASNRSSEVIKSKKKKTSSKTNRDKALPKYAISDDEGEEQQKAKQSYHTFKSSEFVDDESDDEATAEFFEKERLLRRLLDMNGGKLTDEAIKMFSDGSWKTFRDRSEFFSPSQHATSITPQIPSINSREDSLSQNSFALDFNETQAEKGSVTAIQSDLEHESHENKTQNNSLDSDSDNSSGSDEQEEVSYTTMPSLNSDSSRNASKRSIVNKEEDDDEELGSQDDEPVIRKKVRRVIDSDDD
ncbi:hypothetical protein PACTADRAFT_185640 [Pachysolen tannophilus NRRL Y-2460]|uniref:Topoisomerase 1-associated factor 1 n=1 Tax=Pachysolen tannophilus NRRL Y-2460 TaxID=669874 RepID=A0A1E4U1Z2_PACTA|nr:hypothetical protein PACTADRAFT_185640 [Pachysolen tannophilus NRRL Y-2460]